MRKTLAGNLVANEDGRNHPMPQALAALVGYESHHLNRGTIISGPAQRRISGG